MVAGSAFLPRAHNGQRRGTANGLRRPEKLRYAAAGLLVRRCVRSSMLLCLVLVRLCPRSTRRRVRRRVRRRRCPVPPRPVQHFYVACARRSCVWRGVDSRCQHPSTVRRSASRVTLTRAGAACIVYVQTSVHNNMSRRFHRRARQEGLGYPRWKPQYVRYHQTNVSSHTEQRAEPGGRAKSCVRFEHRHRSTGPRAP